MDTVHQTIIETVKNPQELLYAIGIIMAWIISALAHRKKS